MDQRILDLITSHTGDVRTVDPVTGGQRSAATAIVRGDLGSFFVKANPNRPGGHLEAARREAVIGPHLDGVAPTYRFHTEDERWFVLGVDVLDARPTDLAPGSVDLPVLVQALDRITAIGLPTVVKEWVDTRWDRFASEEEVPFLRGDALTHADLHGHNILVDPAGRGWVVDWDWPTRASVEVMLTSVAVQLVSSGHSPKSAQSWVEQAKAWSGTSPEGVRVCAAVNARMQESFAQRWPQEQWLVAMLDAAKAWHKHVQVTRTSVPRP